MSKKIKNLIIYTISIVTITSIVNISILNKINDNKIKETETEITTQIENDNTNNILTMMCDFSNEKEIICE